MKKVIGIYRIVKKKYYMGTGIVGKVLILVNCKFL